MFDLTSGVISNTSVNSSLRRQSLRICRSRNYRIDTVCTVLQNLLNTALHPDALPRNITFRSLARVLNSNNPIDVNTSHLTSDSEQPAIDMTIIPVSSHESLAVLPVLSAFRVPHFSSWASSPLFSYINEYPHFFRTVPCRSSPGAGHCGLNRGPRFQLCFACC